MNLQASVAVETAERDTHPLLFLLWSNKHAMWWLPGAWGYTEHRDEAGRFTQDEAIKHVINSSYSGLVGQATLMVVDHPAVTE